MERMTDVACQACNKVSKLNDYEAMCFALMEHTKCQHCNEQIQLRLKEPNHAIPNGKDAR